jgi:DNA-directed RNA polymerase subunit alpha
MLIIQRPTIEILDEGNQYRQRFAMGPLDPGFGHTIGNSLRRTLLAAIPGAAITAVRFQDALHEFTTIPGVKEDVSEIILNLKDIVVVSEADEPVVLSCDASGPGEVTAAAFGLPPEIQIVNPDQHIATLSSSGRLVMEVTVERGKGYMSAEQTSKEGPIGLIPVDAIFSPVRRVAFSVEPVRVDQSTNYDRLVLDVETDGSITPRDALASAGNTLKSLMSLVAEISDQAHGLELGDISSSPIGSPDIDVPVEDLELSERSRNCLKRAQIDTIGQLIERSAEELMAIPNFGDKSLKEVQERLDERGLSLREA